MPCGQIVTPDFLEILRTLAQHGVDHIVVGGVSAVLQGAPISTFDVDVVHDRAPANLSRLERALQDLNAWYREHPQRRPCPTQDNLASDGHHLLMTKAGPLDVLGIIGNGHDYEELLGFSKIIKLEETTSVRILDLGFVIKTKEEVGSDKDRAVLPVLRETLRQRDAK